MAKSGTALTALPICLGVMIFPMIAPTAIGQRIGPGMMYWYEPGYGINSIGFQTGYGPSYGMGPCMMGPYQSPFMGFGMGLIWLIFLIVVAYFVYKLIKSERILSTPKPQ